MRLEFETSVISPSRFADDAFAAMGSDLQQTLNAGISAAQSGDRQTARRLLFQASGMDPRCEDVWMWLASISEYPEELLVFLTNAIDINPENGRAIEWRAATRSLLAKTFVQRAIAADQEGDAARARECLEHAFNYDGECEMAWFWKASFEGDEDQKLECLERVLEINPENTEAQNARSAILTARSTAAFVEAKSAAVAGRRKKALELVEEFLRSEPEIADAWILRSHLAINLDDKIESLRRALEIDPENTAARSNYDFLTETVGDTRRQTDEDLSKDVPDTMVEDSPLPSNDISVNTSFDGGRADETADYPVDQPGSDDRHIADAEYAAVVENTDDSSSVAEAPADEETGVDRVVSEQAPPQETLDDRFLHFESAVPPESSIFSHHTFFESSEAIPLDAQVPSCSDESSDAEMGELAEHVPPPTENGPQLEPDKGCPYCHTPNEPQAFSCSTCEAVLTLSDIEGLLNNQRADRVVIQQAVTQMEGEWNFRDYSCQELVELGIGHLNLGHHQSGYKFIEEASRLEPNNVVLSAQLNTIAIRLDEMRRQEEVHEAMPKGKTILVVDDSATVRKLISGKLEKSGHHVICAEDGIEALERIEERIPDLVLLDITMPRMDGYEVCKQIRSNPAAKDLPVVMISGKDGFFDKVRGRMAGSTGYVTKPFGPETLMKALETYLRPENQIAA